MRAWALGILAAALAAGAALACMAILLCSPAAHAQGTGVEFEKYWDDAGYEDRRPESVTFHLYREDDPGTELASTTLTASDAILLEPDHWHGCFDGFPTEDGEGNPIAYVVTEDVPENYIASYDYGYDGYEVTFTDDSWIYATYSMYLGYKDEAGDWWSAQIYEWSGGRIPATDDEVAIGGSYAIAPSNRSPYMQKNSDYISDAFMTKPGRLPRHDIKYLQKVYGNDCSRIRTMANWPVGYSEAWEYKANLGRHTPVMRINEDSVSWGLGNTHDWDRDGICFQIESITPTRGNRGIEITDTINLRDFPVTKKWDDEGMEAYRPGSVTVDVYQDDGTEPYATKVIRSTDATDGNTWEATFESLPKYFDDGSYREHEYTLVERPVEGYSTEYDSEWYNGLEFEFGDDTMIGFNDFRSFRSPTKTVWQQENHRGSSWFIRSGETREGTQTVVSAATGLRYSLIGSDFMFYRLSTGTGTWTTTVDYSPGFSVNNVRRVHIDREYVDWSGYDSGTMIQLFNGTHPTKTLVNIAEGTFYPVSKEEAEAENKCYYYKWDYSRPFADADTITNRTLRRDIPFEKYWDDEGYEDRRPASVTFHLYRESEPDEEIASVTLSAADAVDGEDDHWHGNFHGILLRDGEDATAFVVTEDVPDDYIASYDYGYDGYEFTFDDESLLASTCGLFFDYCDKSGVTHTGSLYSITDIPFTSFDYEAAGQSFSVGYQSGTASYTLDDESVIRYDIKHPIEVYGDEYPQTMRGYPVGYSVAWYYKANRGRHTPRMKIDIHSTSWGNGAGYYSGSEWHPYYFGFSKITPVRNPDKPIEITNTINLRKYEITKVWDDEGFEQHRPSSVTIDLYKQGLSSPYATKSFQTDMTADSQMLSFTELPRYDGYSEIEYMPVERAVSGYCDAIYDSEWLNGLDVSFTAESDVGVSNFYNILPGNEKYYNTSHPSQGFFRREEAAAISGLPWTTFSTEFAFDTSEYGPTRPPVVGIDSVKRVHVSLPSWDPQTLQPYMIANYMGWDSHYAARELGQPPSSEDGFVAGRTYFHYKWDDTQPFAGADTIINRTLYTDLKFTKLWDDDGHESERPESSTFDLYDGSGNLIRTVTLTEEDAYDGDEGAWISRGVTGHAWVGSFGEWLSYDDDGNKIPYVIRERPIPGYQTLYDSDDEDANMTELTLSAADWDSKYWYLTSDIFAVANASGNDGTYYDYDSMKNRHTINDDGTITLTVAGSRMLFYMNDRPSLDILSIRRTGVSYSTKKAWYDGYRSSPVDSYYYSIIRNPNYAGVYDLIYANDLPIVGSHPRAEGTSYSYALYEQTEPFPYDNVIRNRFMRQVTAKKVSESSDPLGGATLAFVKKLSDGTETEVGRWVSDGTGTPDGIGLEPGRYVLREVDAPTGYAVAADIEFRVSPAEQVFVEEEGGAETRLAWHESDFSYLPMTVTDSKTVVLVSKVDDDGNGLAGCTLQVLDAGGEVVTEFSTTGEPRRLEGVLTGGRSYVLHEADAPDRYAIARDLPFTVAAGATADSPQTVTLVNGLVSAQISKKSLTGTGELPGASLTLTEKGGDKVDEWVSGTTPHAIGSDKLVRGRTYVLHEEGAPDGYAYATDIEFTVGLSGSPDVVVMRDDTTKVSVSKVEVTGGPELPGASLAVIDADGKTVDEWVSGTTPHLIEGRLVAGATYVLHEVTAPDGHEVASDIEFMVSRDGSIDKVEMVDEVSEELERHDEGAPTDDVASDKETRQDADARNSEEGGSTDATKNRKPNGMASDMPQMGDVVVAACVTSAVASVGSAAWVRTRKRDA